MNLGVVAALIWWLVVEQRYLYNCVAGPFHIAATALVSDYGSSSRQEFFAVDDTLDATDTGVYISHTTNGAETSKDYFLAAPVGDRLLLIKSGSGTPAKQYQGELTSVPVDIRQLIEEALRKQRSLAFGQTFYPFMLDSTSYRFNAYLAIGFGLPIFALCAYNLKKAFVRFEDVQRSPTFQATRRYGQDVSSTAARIDAEASSDDAKKYGAFTLTPSWLLHNTFFSFTPFHLSDIVWVYPKRTQHYYYFIPTGKSHAIVIADEIGRRVEGDLGRGGSSEKRAQEFIGEISARIPWVITGYSEELKSLYDKHRTDFVKIVQERQQQYQNQTR